MELNLYNSLKDPEKLMSLLKEADIATLSLVLSHVTSDLSYVDKIKPFVKGAFDYSVNVPEDDAHFIRGKLIEVLQKDYYQKTKKNGKQYLVFIQKQIP